MGEHVGRLNHTPRRHSALYFPDAERLSILINRIQLTSGGISIPKLAVFSIMLVGERLRILNGYAESILTLLVVNREPLTFCEQWTDTLSSFGNLLLTHKFVFVFVR